MIVGKGSLAWATSDAKSTAYSEAGGDVSNATLYTAPVRIENMTLYSVTLTTTGGGSPTGTFKVQVSSSQTQLGTDGFPLEGAVAMVWVDLASATAAFTTDASKHINVTDSPHLWFRIVWTKTSGTGTVTGIWSGKGLR